MVEVTSWWSGWPESYYIDQISPEVTEILCDRIRSLCLLISKLKMYPTRFGLVSHLNSIHLHVQMGTELTCGQSVYVWPVIKVLRINHGLQGCKLQG